MTVATAQPESIIESLPTLGSPPIVYQRLVEVMDDPRAGVAEVAEVIQQDTALTVRLLRIVNSALFSMPNEVDRVLDAVNVLGMTQVRDLALATSVKSLFGDVPPELLDTEKFWRHSLACGVCARVIAATRREADVERFFVAGMLHDVGRLMLFLGAPEQAALVVEHARHHDNLLYESERELAGFDHAMIGGVLMDRWNMAGGLRQSVRFHHEPARAEEHPLEAAVVHVADILANALQLGSSGESTVPPLAEKAWLRLSIAPPKLPALVERIEEQYAESLGLFGLDA